MKYPLLSLLFFVCCQFLSYPAHSQDTIKVQTFEWSSNNRADVFQFPDDPNQTYRKIWMKYNMRCHDNQVGNGSVGCREWDYSCNTFITDSSRVDSTRLLHPSHIVSNFSGDVFAYTNSTVYNYTQYQQHETQVNISNEVGSKIGDGLDELLISDNQSVGKIQLLYTADELINAGLSAGEIHALDFVPTQNGSVGFLRIKLKATNEAALSALTPEEGFSEVYFKNTQLVAGAAQRFAFYQPFIWDGTSNIIVELSFTQEPTAEMLSFEATNMGVLSSAMTTSYADYALHFSGAGTIEVPTDNFDQITDEITISFWAKGIPETMPTNSTIFEGKDNANNRQANVHLPWGNGQVYWDCGNDGGGYDRINKQANEADYEGQWNHWAFTKNANTGQMKIYLNGELWHSGTGKTKPISIDIFNIGSATPGGPNYFGSIDEFRVWSAELDQATIQLYMRHGIDPNHVNIDDLIAYFRMDEGTGDVINNDAPSGGTANVILPNWERLRGKDLYKEFVPTNMRANAAFIQGDASVQDQVIAVVDSLPAAQHSVEFFGVTGTDLTELGQSYYFPAGYSYVVTEDGTVVDSVWFNQDGEFEITDLVYFDKRPAKYEILSLVTPYGNGLSLGAAGKTFTFDVTDYAPILKGAKRMSIELGGEWQEELDIEFWFVTGTPEREVLNVQNIWPFRRGWYAQIQSDEFFEPRDIPLAQDGSHFKLRSAITGHGQNGEFVPRNHYLNVNGGSQEFIYQVWKECADNPIYPQGGTWIFDRAGWCPGAATDVHEFDITSMVTAGGAVEIDYGVNGAFMDQANYLVSNQLVTYGAYNYATDASVERIARPNNSDVEFERINPACATPLILVKNTGGNNITSLKIAYGVEGNADELEYDWSGIINPGQTVEIELPVTSVGFWQTAANQEFYARLVDVNGSADENAENDEARSAFELATVFQNDEEHILVTKTNNDGNDYSYNIRNANGDIVMQRNSMFSNTTYEDALDLPAGCYTLTFNDAGHDGLSFWFFPENGNGSLWISKYFTPTIMLPVESFDPDFGSGVQFDFVIEEVVANDEDEKFRAISTFPNPATDAINVELRGFEGEEISIEVVSLQGQILQSNAVGQLFSTEWSGQVGLSGLPAGMYFLKVKSANKVWVNEFVKL